jgi:hypothetical protein
VSLQKESLETMTITATCPACEGKMTLAIVTPSMFVAAYDDMTYRCTKCELDVKRTFRRSGLRA